MQIRVVTVAMLRYVLCRRKLAYLLESLTSLQNTLCLADKMKVIEYAKQTPSAGTRKIAETFECGRTQIQMSCVMKYCLVVMQKKEKKNRLLLKMTQRKRMRVMRNLQALSQHSEKL